jgi:adhesin/invasin
LTVTVEDAYGNVVTGYTGRVHFTSSDQTAALPANYTFTAADKGVHAFVSLVLRKRGKQTITITDTLNSLLTSSQVEDVR